MKISKLILMSMAVGYFGVHATTVSSESATSWGNAFSNSELLGVKIHLGNKCITTKYGIKKVNAPRNLKILDIGASVAPLEPSSKGTTVGVHIVPYVYVTSINDRNSLVRLYLIPGVQRLKNNPSSFGKFYVACESKYNRTLASLYLRYYPVVLLHVDNKNRRNVLLNHLQNLFWNGFLRNKIDDVSSVRTVGDLLKKVFRLKQAEFLKGLPFNVCVELIDERKKANMKFVVQNVKGSASSLCWQQPQQAQTSPTNEQAKLAVTQSTQQQSVAVDDSDDQIYATTNHRLIVVSLSVKLKEQAKVIRESFNEVFSNLKRAKSETPFTLITIQTGRRLYALLNDKEMPSLPSSGDNSIQGKLERSMQFGATDLRALDDLRLVDTFIQYQEDSAIGRVLYLTDNARMSDNSMEISRKQRGVPLAWHTDGIDLTVLTTEKCQVWKDVKAKCVSWQGKTVLERELNAFFQK